MLTSKTPTADANGRFRDYLGNHASAFLIGYPTEVDKGKLGGSCNRITCQRPEAFWLHGNGKYYCGCCSADLNYINRGNPHWILMKLDQEAKDKHEASKKPLVV